MSLYQQIIKLSDGNDEFGVKLIIDRDEILKFEFGDLDVKLSDDVGPQSLK